MQLFVHDPRITLEMIAPPGPVLVPEPPYWFGKKARRGPFSLPRETRARLTIPAGVAPGPVGWQAANANGATAPGRFVVGELPVLVEQEGRVDPQLIAELPIRIAGQIKHIREVDEYEFTASRNGPVTCAITARTVGSSLNPIVEVRDQSGRMIADAADTGGHDTALTFAAEADKSYRIRVYDLDFRGNRAFTYQLDLTPGPRVVAAIPAGGRRGETRAVEFVGYGIASGQPQLESVVREVSFPAEAAFGYRLETPHGTSPPFRLYTSVLPQTVEPMGLLTLPVAVTGIISQRYGHDRYRVAGKQGDVWSISAAAEAIGSPLDLAVALCDAAGKELQRVDDLPGTKDAALEFTVPSDGEYQLVVSDASVHSGNRAATYRLTVQVAEPNFKLSVPSQVNLTLAGKGTIALKIKRWGGFQGPLSVVLSGLPAGVTPPEQLEVPAKSDALNIELTAAADAASSASLVTMTAKAMIDGRSVARVSQPILVATTIVPPFSIDAEGKDDVTKWARGSTFPAPVLINRDDGFDQQIVLEMTSKQGRHRQGIRGPELIAGPGVSRILYPVFLPEWLETTRTSRMVVNGVAKVADPQGNIRYSVSRQKTRMGFLPTGALLKLSVEVEEMDAGRRGTVIVPLSVGRSPQLTETVRIELSPESRSLFAAEPHELAADQSQVAFPVDVGKANTSGEHVLKLRASAMVRGKYPVVSESTVLIHRGPQ